MGPKDSPNQTPVRPFMDRPERIVPHTEVEVVLDPGRCPSTPNELIGTLSELAAACAEIQQQGHATDEAEFREGLRSVAAPIRAQRGMIVGVDSVFPLRTSDFQWSGIPSADRRGRNLGASRPGAERRLRGLSRLVRSPRCRAAPQRPLLAFGR